MGKTLNKREKLGANLPGEPVKKTNKIFFKEKRLPLEETHKTVRAPLAFSYTSAEFCCWIINESEDFQKMAFYIHFFFGFFFIFFSIYFSIFWLANKAAGEWGCFQLAVIFSFLLLLLAESEWKSRKKTAELGRGLNERKDEAREKWGKEKIGQVLVQGRPCVSLLTIFTKFPARTFESRIDALPVVFIRYAYTTRTSGCTLTLVVYVAATAWTHKQEVPPNSIQLFARVRIDGATCTSSFCNSLPFWFIKAKLKKKQQLLFYPCFVVCAINFVLAHRCNIYLFVVYLLLDSRGEKNSSTSTDHRLNAFLHRL